MATTTPNLGLKKPALSDLALISDLNDNFDILDGIINLIYPVGSIYMSVASTDPGSVMPGTTWARLKDKFLLGAGDTYTAGNTGGSATHTLTTNEMPSHNHSFTGSSVTSGGISANHSHSGTSGNQSASHTHTGPNHAHAFGNAGDVAQGSFFTGAAANGTGSLGTTNGGGTGNTGTQSANHTHTTTTGNQSAGHTHSVTASGSIGNKGGGQAFSIMPPYQVVYMWRRTA